MQVVRKIHSDVTAAFRTTPKQRGQSERARAAARSPREDQALLLRRQLPLVPRAASPHGGNLAASHM